MEVHHVEFACVLSDHFEHSYMVCKRIGYIRSLEPQGLPQMGRSSAVVTESPLA